MENSPDVLLAPGDEVPLDAVAVYLADEADAGAEEIAAAAAALRSIYRAEIVRTGREAIARYGERDALVALLVHLGFGRREVVAMLRAAGANGTATATVAAAITRTWAAFPE